MYCLARRLAVQVDSFPGETLWEKINFSLASGYQLEIVSGLCMGACVSFSFGSRTPTCADLAGPAHAATVSEFLHVPALLRLEGLDS